MVRLKYPLDLNENTTDFVTFDHFPYTTNRPISGQRSAVRPGARGSGPVDGIAPPGGGSGRSSITLYIPNSIPKMGYKQIWEQETAPGAAGTFERNLAGLGVDVLSSNNPFETGKRIGEAIGGAFSAEGVGTGIAAVRQKFIEQLARGANANANSLIALGTGQIFNPNVEVVYQGPVLRDFSFSFTFAPKNSTEARAIKDIIFEFKKWSAPTVEGAQGGMLKIPDVWLVRYNGLFKFNVNPFKKATLKGVDVGYNPGLNTHMTFDDGEPVVITIRLDFTEVDYILQEDHDKARNAGYLGGF